MNTTNPMVTGTRRWEISCLCAVFVVACAPTASDSGSETADTDTAFVDTASTEWGLTDTGSNDTASTSETAQADADLDTDIDGDVQIDVDGQPDVKVWSSCPPKFANVDYAPCVGPLHCVLVERCCCGICVDETYLECMNGHFGTVNDDTCFFKPCSDGCKMEEWKTPDGACLTCAKYQSVFQAAWTSKLAPLTACSVAADCTIATLPSPCDGPCVVPLAKNATSTAGQLWTELAQPWCAAKDAKSCSLGCGYVSSDKVPACIKGNCIAVGPCDPLVTVLGDPCDDGDPCTIGDGCVAAHVCKGTTDACDDDNACTTDACSPAGACSHKAMKGLCETGVACSLGGVCEGGTCVDGGFSGFSLPIAGDASSDSLDHPSCAVTDLGVVFGVSRVAAAPLLKRLTAKGELVWSTTLSEVGARVKAIARDEAQETVAIGCDALSCKQLLAWRLDGQGKVTASANLPLPWVGATAIGLRTPPGATVSSAAIALTMHTVVNKQHLWVGQWSPSGALVGADLGPVASEYQIALAVRKDAALVLATAVIGAGPSAAGPLRLLRTDAAGAIVLDITETQVGSNHPAGAVATSDGAWIVAWNGVDLSGESKTSTGRIARRDDAGNVLWSQTIGYAVTLLHAAGKASVMVTWDKSAGPVSIRSIDNAGNTLSTYAGELAIVQGAKAMVATADSGLWWLRYDGFKATGWRMLAPCVGANCSALSCP